MTSEIEFAYLITKQKMRALTEREILFAAPEHDQRNAALGILSDAEAQTIRDAVASARTKYHAEVAELDAIMSGEGTDEDKILAIKQLASRLTDA